MATVPNDVTVLYEYKFSQIFNLLAQQIEERIPQSFRQGVHTGAIQAQAVKQIGIINGPDQRTTRLDPVTFADVAHDARWVYPKVFDKYVPFDTFDEIMTMADPKSTYAEAMRAMMNRAHDDECIRAFFETSNTGELGASTTVFPTGSSAGSPPAGGIVGSAFGASADTGLTVAKLREARRALLANEVDIDIAPIHVIAGATQLDNLLAEAQVINRDFNQPDAPVLAEGKITRFLGMEFKHSERLLLDSTGAYRMVPVYSGMGMHFGTWLGITTRIIQREDLRMHPWQIGIWASFGATRLQEKMVMQILCLK